MKKEEKMQKAKEERERFIDQMTEKKAVERAEIVKHARRLILYRRPLCRRINRALLVSECLRELDAQIAFQKTIKQIDKLQDINYGNILNTDREKYEKEEKRKAEEKLQKDRNYGVELRRQIEEKNNNNKLKEIEKFKVEREDIKNMSLHLQLIKEYEAEQLSNKKKKLKEFFTDAIEEKRQYKLKLNHDNEFEDRALEIYRNAKAGIQKMHKMMKSKETEEKERNAQLIAAKQTRDFKSETKMEEEMLKKALAQRETIEKEKEKENVRRERENATKVSMQAFKVEYETAKGKQAKREKDIQAWEMIQRFKRAEYDKEFEIDHRTKQRNKQSEYATALQKRISEKVAERETEKILEEKATRMTETIDKSNKQILNYAKEVFDESKSVRPVYPILKAIEECKREMGLITLNKSETVLPDKKPKKTRRIRPSCTTLVPDHQIIYL